MRKDSRFLTTSIKISSLEALGNCWRKLLVSAHALPKDQSTPTRTGVLRRFGADHTFGSACYRPDGCSELIYSVADRIDARQFNRSFPKVFPRFIQHAIWRYCSQAGLDVCNGNQIDDMRRCGKRDCRLRLLCDRIALRL